ncbi:MAG: D-tyrosyl-tRNA(Tyr) deacylase [Armatimonadetes bacterium]|nr:D-tyrosyl-tRNA(Tyr) deacylase [Armatimonadota bacterium]
MKAVVQRVNGSSVTVDGERIAKIGRGLAVLLGVEKGDTTKDVNFLAEKIANLRIFEDDAGKMNLSVLDVHGEALVVSQFTLLGDCSKGRRPGFDKAASPDLADSMYNEFVEMLNACGVPVQTGRFGAKMLFDIANYGPVTFILDTR